MCVCVEGGGHHHVGVWRRDEESVDSKMRRTNIIQSQPNVHHHHKHTSSCCSVENPFRCVLQYHLICRGLIDNIAWKIVNKHISLHVDMVVLSSYHVCILIR